MKGFPPSRYRVIERDRRLTVVDTWADHRPDGRPVHVAQDIATTPMTMAEPVSLTTQPPAMAAPRSATPLAERARSIERTTSATSFTTHRLYDQKGPRTILIDDRARQSLGNVQVFGMIIATVAVVTTVFFPFLLIIPAVVIVNPVARTAIRRAITTWLDSLDQAGTSASAG